MNLTTTRPTLNFVNDDDGEEIEIAFGYFGEERTPTAALFHGDELVLIPVSVLAIAISSGWEDDYSILCAALKDDSPCPHCADDDDCGVSGNDGADHFFVALERDLDASARLLLVNREDDDEGGER